MFAINIAVNLANSNKHSPTFQGLFAFSWLTPLLCCPRNQGKQKFGCFWHFCINNAVNYTNLNKPCPIFLGLFASAQPIPWLGSPRNQGKQDISLYLLTCLPLTKLLTGPIEINRLPFYTVYFDWYSWHLCCVIQGAKVNRYLSISDNIFIISNSVNYANSNKPFTVFQG